MYSRILTHALTTLKYLMDVDLNKITAEDYVQLSYLTWSDYVYSKNYVIVYPLRRKAIVMLSSQFQSEEFFVF